MVGGRGIGGDGGWNWRRSLVDSEKRECGGRMTEEERVVESIERVWRKNSDREEGK